MGAALARRWRGMGAALALTRWRGIGFWVDGEAGEGRALRIEAGARRVCQRPKGAGGRRAWRHQSSRREGGRSGGRYGVGAALAVRRWRGVGCAALAIVKLR